MLGDKTGPEGRGPLTGRGAGFCAGFPTPGYMNSGRGRGLGRGRGFGKGFGRYGVQSRYSSGPAPGNVWSNGPPK